MMPTTTILILKIMVMLMAMATVFGVLIVLAMDMTSFNALFDGDCNIAM